jgi:hypothetical protein
MRPILILLAAPFLLSAQAWTPPKGELNLAITYHNLFVGSHLNSDGSGFDDGQIFTQIATMDLTYAFTDRLALKVGIPYVGARYDGPSPHARLLDAGPVPATPCSPCGIDNGKYHSTFQDFTVDLRYNLIRRRSLVITPMFDVIAPSHDYTYFAHSAVGRDLREFRLGVNVGRRLDPLLPRAFIQAQSAYRVTESVINYHRNGMYNELELGYFVNRRLALLGIGTWSDTFGGFSYDPNVWSSVANTRDAIAQGVITEQEFLHHDQIGHDRQFNAGGGAVYQVNPRVALFASFTRTVAGANGHALASAVAVGANWTIQTRGETKKSAKITTLGGADTLAQARCMCPQK